MASDRLGELIKKLESSSAIYENQATLLSDTIEHVEEHLITILTGNVAAEVSEAGCKSPIFLSFRRGNEGRWHLFIANSAQPKTRTYLTSAPLNIKIRATKLFHPLFEAMLNEQDSQCGEIESALDCIEPLAEALQAARASEGGASGE